MSKQEPRSIRLTQEHRRDMVSAVLNEWMKQNPQPSTDISFHSAVIEQVKQSEAYCRTGRMIDRLESDDWRYLKLQERVLVTITDSEGGVRNTTQIEFPVAFARRHGLVGIDTKMDEYRVCLAQEGMKIDSVLGGMPNAYSGLSESDIFDESTKVVADGDDVRVAIVCSMRWISDNRISVQIGDDSEAYKAYRAAQRARREWESERNTLRRETEDLLQQFNTTKQIREGWPAMVPYFPPHIADPESVIHLPVLAVDRLSERLGIK